VEIRRLAGDPFQETFYRRMRGERAGFRRQAREFGIGEVGMNRPVADRMDSDPVTSASAFGPGMVPLGPSAQRSAAEPARRVMYV
jgi:hypothetical protein